MEQDTNNQAEFQALEIGLQKCRSLGIQKLEIWGDSAIVINALRKEVTPSGKLNALLERTLSIIKSFVTVLLNHIYREGNRLSNELANKATDGI